MDVAAWEYCQLSWVTGRWDGDFYFVKYHSSWLQQQVDEQLLRTEFRTQEEALSFLGGDGWEAFHVDPDGTWHFKRFDDEDSSEVWAFDDEDNDEESD